MQTRMSPEESKALLATPAGSLVQPGTEPALCLCHPFMQTRVSPEEYKEFLTLGHGEIFSLDLDAVVDAPWR